MQTSRARFRLARQVHMPCLLVTKKAYHKGNRLARLALKDHQERLVPRGRPALRVLPESKARLVQPGQQARKALLAQLVQPGPGLLDQQDRQDRKVLLA